MQLPAVQHDVLSYLSGQRAPVRIAEIAAALRLDQSPVAAACAELRERGAVEVEERPYSEYGLGRDASSYVEQPLPERVIVRVLAAQQGSCRITDIPGHGGPDAATVGQSLRWLAQRGWAEKQGDLLVLRDAGRAAEHERQPDERMLAALAGGRVARTEDLAAEGIDVSAALALLAKRKGFLNVKERVERLVRITEAGATLLAGASKPRPTVTQLTPELLTDGGWREVELRPYDVTLAARRLFAGKEHAFQRTLEKVRRVFLEMGFTEVVSPWIESSFWDFDALFQPQDHPARDMQDTFYVARPARCRLPDEALVERTRRTHEDGGDTGSTGWRYRWSREMAHKPVLRTHTTAATIRALAAHAAHSEDRIANSEVKSVDVVPPAGAAGHAGTASADSPSQPLSRPGKYFVIGPVFRRETVDYKHLPVFHQVDGIVVDRQASLATLLGTLAAFYAKMGYPKVRFRPSFFPYTEPSAEVYLWLEQRQEWVEMGGSGLFRPEVTLPLGIRDRVLAWGLGLERLAMMIHGLKSIGELYFATMPWLREAPLRRA